MRAIRPQSFIVQPSRGYERLTTEEYLSNTRNALKNTQMQRAKLKPLLEANHTSDTATYLYAMPQTPYNHGAIDYYTDIVG